MLAFISHSFENKPEYENVVDALEARSVTYWSTAEVKAGASLREQLRLAVDKCGVCIFVATKSAIDSSWCGAELGAFWGAGKPIIVYLAEPSLTEDELPPIVQGDVWERRISRIADRTKELLSQAQKKKTTTSTPAQTSVTELTVEQLERLVVGAVSMAAATKKSDEVSPSLEAVAQAARGAAGRILAGVRATQGAASLGADDWHNKIIWVDDRPDNNVYEREAFEAMGFEFTLALSTQEALRILAKHRFAAIISDMGREEGPREGYALLEAVRATDKSTPFFIYAGSRAPKHQREAAHRGAQGTTNIANELIDMVLKAVPTGSPNEKPPNSVASDQWRIRNRSTPESKEIEIEEKGIEQFQTALKQALHRDRQAFEGKYKDEINQLLSLSREEIDSVTPDTTDFQHYDQLITVVKEASRNNVSSADLKSRLEDLGAVAIDIAKRVPSLAFLFT